MHLDLTSFNKAIKSLQEALAEYNRSPNVFVRDACIQRFEYTYELAWKMLKRYLEYTAPNPVEFDEMSFQNLIRIGSEKGLLMHGWDKWSNYRKARTTTSHVYDEKKAEEIFAIIPVFVVEVEYLQQKLQVNM